MAGQLTVNHQRTVNERSNNSQQQTVTSSTAGHSHQQQQSHQIVSTDMRVTSAQQQQQYQQLTYTAAQPQQQLVTYRTERTDNATGPNNWPPIAKVLPQQQSQQQHSNDPPPIVSVSSVSNAQVTVSSGFEQVYCCRRPYTERIRSPFSPRVEKARRRTRSSHESHVLFFCSVSFSPSKRGMHHRPDHSPSFLRRIVALSHRHRRRCNRCRCDSIHR